MFITIKDVAKKAGVSPATVSAVINGRKGISEETRRKVMEAIRELNYAPNVQAQSLVKKVSPNILFVVPNHRVFESGVNVQILEAIGSELGKGEAHLILVSLQDDFRGKKFMSKMTSYIQMHRPSGVVFMDVFLSKHQLEWLKKIPIPSVFLNQDLTIPGLAAVTSDNMHGGRLVAQHFYEIGVRHPLILGPLFTLSAGKRRDGFNEVWRQLTGGEAAVFETREFGVLFDDEAERLKSFIIEFDGIFALSDRLAVSVLGLLHRIGISVPSQMVLAGYDDDPISCMTYPKLTTIKQDGWLIGRQAFYLLREGAPAGKFVVGVKLVVRESTGGAA